MEVLTFIVKFVCIVGLPLFFLAGLCGPLVVAWLHGHFDVEQREMKKEREARRLRAQGPKDPPAAPKRR
jgi:hypothetical protein